MNWAEIEKNEGQEGQNSRNNTAMKSMIMLVPSLLLGTTSNSTRAGVVVNETQDQAV